MTDKTATTPTPWPEPEYDNHGNGGFSEWWGLGGIATFQREADAKLCRRAVNAHDGLVTALEKMLSIYWGEGDGHWPPPACVVDAQAALTAAKEAP